MLLFSIRKKKVNVTLHFSLFYPGGDERWRCLAGSSNQGQADRALSALRVGNTFTSRLLLYKCDDTSFVAHVSPSSAFDEQRIFEEVLEAMRLSPLQRFRG